MQITAAKSTMSSSPIEPQAPSTPAPAAPSPDPVVVHRVAALLAALENKPEVRSEVVARGRALAADPSYPPPDIINKLAGMVVGNR
jgi:hypothetical protein